MTDIEAYQKGTERTAIYREGIERLITNTTFLRSWLGLDYCSDKLASEAGEVSEQVSKALRDDDGFITDTRRANIFKELGDVMWYVSQLCNELGFKLGDVMDSNLSKLQDRKDRGVLSGSGDNR